MRKTTILTMVFAAGLFLALHIACSPAEGFHLWPSDRVIGNAAPEISIKEVNGHRVSLSSYKGKTVLLNFWATWCHYCRKERAHLNDLSKDYEDRDLVILSVSTDKSFEDIEGFLKVTPADYKVFTDLDGTAASAYHVSALPTTYLIDNKGMVQRKLLGYRDWSDHESRKLINDLLRN